MKKELYQFGFEVYDTAAELNGEDRGLLLEAHEATSLSYAPYSGFLVGAAARMDNGRTVTGGNQENISFPAGTCAEGVVLASAASLYPNVPIRSLAISYRSKNHDGSLPATPCGICRQRLQEFSKRTGSVVRLITGTPQGKVIVVPDAAALLPLSFSF